MTLQDIREKKTPITIGKTTYNLLYDLNAFAELEEIYGSVDKAIEKLTTGSVKEIINILWAGLLHENEALTAKEVGKMLDLSQAEIVGELINKAFTQAVPQVKKATKKK